MRHIPITTVLRNASGDFTNNGISARFNSITLILDVPRKKTIMDNGTTLFGEIDQISIRKYCLENILNEHAVLFLDTRPYNDIYPPICRPLDAVYNPEGPDKKVGPMFGGNYLEYRDHKKNWETFVYAIHDRYETQEEYDTLSR